MKHLLKPAFMLLAIFTLLTGVLYPLLVTGIAQAIFPWQSNGSQIENKNGEVIGSQIIGQAFQEPGYFWSRPSATSDYPDNAGASGGSNLSVLNKTLINQVQERIDRIKSVDADNSRPIPIDLLTASASGLDPHISPQAALYQVNRIARYRGLSESQVSEIVNSHIERPFLGIFGEPRVNVLLLNLALDSVQ